MLLKLKEPFNSLSHFLGMLLSILGLVLLLVNAVKYATVWHIVSFAIYGASLILLYSASTLYHMLAMSRKVSTILKKIDHMMIYVLIAGTYTPVTLVALRGGWGWTLFGIVWGVAVIGIIVKGFWIQAPRWLSTISYLVMGWIVVIAFFPLVETVPIAGIYWLVSGGIAYTVGAVIYATKKPDFAKNFLGFHEIFHLFVLLGSFCHYWFMYKYILFL